MARRHPETRLVGLGADLLGRPTLAQGTPLPWPADVVGDLTRDRRSPAPRGTSQVRTVADQPPSSKAPRASRVINFRIRLVRARFANMCRRWWIFRSSTLSAVSIPPVVLVTVRYA